ncbi:MAG: amidohydrolase family protein [Chloroflexota bacterium]
MVRRTPDAAIATNQELQLRLEGLDLGVLQRGGPAGLADRRHCVGDAAIDATLSAFEAADRTAPFAGRRWTLIHMMLAREDHWARANRLGLIVTAQQPLLYTLAEGFLKYIGPERTHDLEPLRMYLARSEQPVGGGSDSPRHPVPAAARHLELSYAAHARSGRAGSRVEDRRGRL